MAVHVKVETSNTAKPVVIDHDNIEHRKWLGRMAFWAMRNGVWVKTSPTDEPVTFVEKTDDRRKKD